VQTCRGETHRLRFVTDPLYGDHLRGIGHPESPDRVEVVASRLRDLGAMSEEIPARDVTDEELLRVHTRDYLDLVNREVASCHPELVEGRLIPQARYLSTGDVVVDEHSLVVARRAAGGAIAGMEAAVQSKAPVFALVRPPGHHAEPARGMGFCVFNNVAIAARAFQAAYGGRALVVDFDYHHGNGTQAVAGNGLSYVSTHAFPAYPGTGTESFCHPELSLPRASEASRRVEGRRNPDAVINVRLPAAGISTEAFIATWEALLPEVAGAVRPDVIIVSAGFDYVAGDIVGDLGVGVEAAAALAAAINRVAAEFCQGRIVYVLEGGYGLDALTRSMAMIADASDAKFMTPSSAKLAAAPSQVQAALAQISGILQGRRPRAQN
jgi:acetoin utilization deacetylase AcuC-like enzyme